MSTLIALGDTHGRTDWKQIVQKNYFDKAVFIGDYFDTHENISADQQIENFKDIIDFKKQNPDKVVLLIGNHDFHYLRGVNEQYSGFQQWKKFDISDLLHAALSENLLQMSFAYKEFLFSHAGVTKTWCNNNGITENFEQYINQLFINKPLCFRFTPGKNQSIYGDDITQSPIWVRPQSLLVDQIPGYIQVVGHTTQDFLKQIIGTNEGLILIDTISTSGEFLIIEGTTAISGRS